MAKKNYSLGYLLTKSARVVTQMYQKEIMRSNLPVTAPQSGILLVIYEKGSTSQKTLADALHLDKTNISTMSKKLLQSGLIQIQKGPEDARKNYLSLTDKGTEVTKKLMEIDEKIQGELEGFIQKPLTKHSLQSYLSSVLRSQD